MDETEIIKRVIETGKVSLGARSVEKLLKTGKPKLVIISNNCPRKTKEGIQQNAGIGEVPVHEFDGTSMKLGEVCRKPFPISAMAVMSQGQADISKLRSGK